jgi:hypothetical protein
LLVNLSGESTAETEFTSGSYGKHCRHSELAGARG